MSEAGSAAAAKAGAKKDKKTKERKAPAALDPQPAYIAERIEIFDELYAIQQAKLAAKPSTPIRITMPDGSVKGGQSWRTTPMDIAMGISEGLARDVVISKVDGVLWDTVRPLEADCKLVFLKFDDEEAKAVFWHSSAHVLGEAMEQHTGGCLCYGPPIQDGFYYDVFLKDRTMSEENFPDLEELMNKAVKERQPFQRLEMTKADLLRMFDYNDFKKRIINERVTTDTTTVYRCGPLIDLCRGPHVPDTGRIKALSVLKASSTYWEGKADAESLQRVYGISFPDKKLLKEWIHFQEEAAKRDHRKIGREQELFFFHDLSPGSCFFLPRGAHIYNKLVDFIKAEYWRRGFSEVVTPNIYNTKLWEISGHWNFYKDNMFSFEVEKETFALKPMNCPGHCLMFGHRTRSYRELPIRMADFGVLHRNELSGALTGLTRVRRFQQDDAHIFCMESQVEEEIESCLQFLRHVYGVFGFTFELNLSTRPEKYLGEIQQWDRAEKALENALNRFGVDWKIKEGDGAFYGPKIDIQIQDALRRSHQCATIQLDFQNPIRFDLEFTPKEHTEGQAARPVVIHRAILGSVERMIAILTESYGGKWPFWLSPRQALVVAVHPKFQEYALEVAHKLHSLGYQAEVGSDEGATLNKKIRNAQLAQYNFILVVGEQEQDHQTANVRMRDNSVAGERSIDDLAAHFAKLAAEHRMCDNFDDAPASVAAAAPAADGDDAVVPAATVAAAAKPVVTSGPRPTYAAMAARGAALPSPPASATSAAQGSAPSSSAPTPTPTAAAPPPRPPPPSSPALAWLAPIALAAVAGVAAAMAFRARGRR